MDLCKISERTELVTFECLLLTAEFLTECWINWPLVFFCLAIMALFLRYVGVWFYWGFKIRLSSEAPLLMFLCFVIFHHFVSFLSSTKTYWIRLTEESRPPYAQENCRNRLSLSQVHDESWVILFAALNLPPFLVPAFQESFSPHSTLESMWLVESLWARLFMLKALNRQGFKTPYLSQYNIISICLNDNTIFLDNTNSVKIRFQFNSSLRSIRCISYGHLT